MKQLFNIVIVFVLLSVFSAPMHPMQAAAEQEATSSLGTWECWDDGSIDPCHNSLTSVSLASLTDGWAVGINNIMLHWNGSTWTKEPSPIPINFEVVRMNTEDDGWAAGSSGNILHWNGIEWAPVSSPTSSTIRDISIVTTDNVWAAGYKIYHWDGDSWSYMEPPSSLTSYTGISMTPGTNGMDGWAVGSNGKIIHWNGSEWSLYTSPTTEYLYDVEMISANDGWIVGNSGTFLHWNGSEWSPAPTLASDISTIFEVEAASSNAVWAIGFDNGAYVIYKWAGVMWGPSESNVNNISYAGLAVTPDTNGEDAWVVAGGGYILRWDGDDWAPSNAPYIKSLYDIQMLSRTDGWAVGTAFPIISGDALHWDGGSWESQNSMNAFGVDFYTDASGTTGWSVGKWGEIQSFDGSIWDEITSPIEVDLLDVDMLSHDEAWAVGYGYDFSISDNRGVMAHYVEGEWSEVALPASGIKLMGVSMLSPTNGWAVGRNGAILSWNGTLWQEYTSPTTQTLYAISMLDASNGWIVGGFGTIYHWNGIEWSSVASPYGNTITDIAFISPTDGWAVGEVGAILHWDGLNWEQVLAPTQNLLMGIAYASEYELWAVGYNGVIMHYDVTPTLTTNYSSGAPGSFFTLTGTNFPAEATADISINGVNLGDVPTDESGSFNFILSTTLADEGIYYVTASVNPSDTIRIVLDNDEPNRAKDGSYTVFPVPEGIAIMWTMLPIIVR